MDDGKTIIEDGDDEASDEEEKRMVFGGIRKNEFI